MTLSKKYSKAIAALSFALSAPLMIAAAPAEATGTTKDPVLRLLHNEFAATYNAFAAKFNTILNVHEQALKTNNPVTIAATQAVQDEAVRLSKLCIDAVVEPQKAFEKLNQTVRPFEDPAALQKLKTMTAPFYRHCTATALPNVKITASGEVVSDMTFNIPALNTARHNTLKDFVKDLQDLLTERERATLYGQSISGEILADRFNTMQRQYKTCVKISDDYKVVLRQGDTTNIRTHKAYFESQCAVR